VNILIFVERGEPVLSPGGWPLFCGATAMVVDTNSCRLLFDNVFHFAAEDADPE
jgi:hypothetical protein